eukprot:355359-Chlamydomonas_euryale.AAC.14
MLPLDMRSPCIRARNKDKRGRRWHSRGPIAAHDVDHVHVWHRDIARHHGCPRHPPIVLQGRVHMADAAGRRRFWALGLLPWSPECVAQPGLYAFSAPNKNIAAAEATATVSLRTADGLSALRVAAATSRAVRPCRGAKSTRYAAATPGWRARAGHCCSDLAPKFAAYIDNHARRAGASVLGARRGCQRFGCSARAERSMARLTTPAAHSIATPLLDVHVQARHSGKLIAARA